jgi:spore coat protein U-like protein
MRFHAALILVSCILAGGAADAACTVDTDPVSFGRIDPTRLNQATGRVTVDCDEATSFEIGLVGESYGGMRVMRSFEGREMLFQLFGSPSLSIPWGDNSSIGPTIGGSSDGTSAVRVTIYGALPAQQGILPGNYTSQLTVELIF